MLFFILTKNWEVLAICLCVYYFGLYCRYWIFLCRVVLVGIFLKLVNALYDDYPWKYFDFHVQKIESLQVNVSELLLKEIVNDCDFLILKRKIIYSFLYAYSFIFIPITSFIDFFRFWLFRFNWRW